MLIKRLISSLFLGVTLTCAANNVQDTLYINRGTFIAVDGVSFSYLAFNGTPTFNQENKRVLNNVGDDLNLTIINTDSVTHGFTIKNFPGSNLILAGDTLTVSYTSSVPSATIFYDHVADYAYLGLGGMLITTNHTKNFFWNIKEHQQEWNDSIVNGGTMNWQLYEPDYFTINGKSNPDINTDTNARIAGTVGDTIHLYLVNTGKSIHSMHFHGYHSTILLSSKFPNQIGRIKDTFPVYGMEVLKLELIPDKPGEYPVHDHNLVAVTGGNIYPSGMFTTMLIE